MNVIHIPKALVWISLTLLVLVTIVDGTYAQGRGGRGGDEGGRRGDGETGGRGGRRGGRGGPDGMPGGPDGMPGGPGGMPGGPGGMPGGPGGMPGGPGGMPGGPGGWGGPGGMPGGPGGWGGPGGMRGGFGGGGGPAGFLGRMDANGNGMLDPEESQGPARMFLDRIAGEAKLDLSRPIPLDAITKAFEEMRNRRSQEGGGDRGGGRGEEGGPGRGDNGSSARNQPEVQPLVPGFGEPDLFDPVPGFGDLGERFAVKIEEQDMQEATRTMGRSDTNQDGVLDADEIRNGRWGVDPLQTDRNRDGKLTINELALRYAIRRNEENGGNSSRTRTAGRGTSSRSGPGSSSQASAQNDRQNRMMDMIFRRYDTNRSNVLEREEWGSFRSDPSGYDTDKDGKITREEFAAGMAGQLGGRGRGGNGNEQSGWFARRDGGQGGGENAASSASSSSAPGSSDRKSYRIASATERLSALEGLPEWFARSDADGDGQVRMSEYATSWTDDVVADFAQFDLNGDGIVTPKECISAVEGGAVQGIAATSTASSSRSYGRGRDRQSTPGGGETSAVSAAAPPAASGPASSGPASSGPASSGAAPAGLSAKYLRFAVGVIQKYDSNKDGALTADEWSKMNKDYSSADTDKDGRITPAELAPAFSQTQ